MKTSYFAKYKGKDAVSIAIKTPAWFKGTSYPALFPTWEMINRYKRDNDKGCLRQELQERDII